MKQTFMDLIKKILVHRIQFTVDIGFPFGNCRYWTVKKGWIRVWDFNPWGQPWKEK